MADFTVPYGTPWLETFVFGTSDIRMRLDDWTITAEIKALSDDSVIETLTLANGRLVVSDPVTRRLEANLPWDAVEALGAGKHRFDFVFVNNTTEQRERDPGNGSFHTLTVPSAVTFYPTEA